MTDRLSLVLSHCTSGQEMERVYSYNPRTPEPAWPWSLEYLTTQRLVLNLNQFNHSEQPMSPLHSACDNVTNRQFSV